MNDRPGSAGPCLSPAECSPADCDRGCGVAAVDALLHESAAVRGEDVDALLDLRWLLRHPTDAEAVLGLFCRLRRSLEDPHYLNCFRLRRWLENHIEVRFVAVRGGTERCLPLRLDGFCLEAIRCACLRAAIRPGEPLLAPRVTFIFRVPRPQPPAPISAAAGLP